MLEPEKFRKRLHERFESVRALASKTGAAAESLQAAFEGAAYDVVVEHLQEMPTGPPRSVIEAYEKRATLAELEAAEWQAASDRLVARLEAVGLRAWRAEEELSDLKRGGENGRG